MPVDYSKWDALELSDDSDIEVHPNVDKRSFIRAKQNQIHQQRFERKHRITTLKYERGINDGLLARIEALLQSLEKHREELEGGGGNGKEAVDVDEAVFDALVESGEGKDDLPPTPPEGVHIQEQQQDLRWSKMMGALVDQVKSSVDKSTPASSKAAQRFRAYVAEITSHSTRVEDLQRQLRTELVKLEKEESGKITSEGIHTGFDSTHVSKSTSTPVASNSRNNEDTQLLNPTRPTLSPRDSGAEADIEDGAGPDTATPARVSGGNDDDDDDMEASPTAKRFGLIHFGDYTASLAFISTHPSILVERETDGLLVEAFNAQLDEKPEYARQCVHQALLLQYCRQLGRDGVGLFFKRVQTPGHQARKLFLDDVNSTYARIRERTAELAKNQRERDGQGQGVEQIQLHAVDPGTSINISIPPATPSNEEERQARLIFDSLAPGLQRALESGSLDRVNEVLGKMSVEEAEEVVEKLGAGGMLSMEEGVIDATTEEGMRRVEEIERGGGEKGTVENAGNEAEEGGLAVDEVD